VNKSPLIVDLKRHSLEDGPGIRTVVFFKGCPLRCVFCHSPETQDCGREVAFYPGKCIRCGQCAAACPRGAIELDLPGRIHRERCLRCGGCAGACPAGGLRLLGSSYEVEHLAEILLRDRAFFRHSGGGVTLSGGECTLFPEYLEALLHILKKEGVHVALETSGYFDYPLFRRKLLPHLDLIYFDVKIGDPGLHRQYCGKSNRRIHRNLQALLRDRAAGVHPRIPLVPEITATAANLAAIVDLLCRAGAGDITLLPYNPLGLGMAVNLGRPKPPLPERFMTPDEERMIQEMFLKIIGRRNNGCQN